MTFSMCRVVRRADPESIAIHSSAGSSTTPRRCRSLSSAPCAPHDATSAGFNPARAADLALSLPGAGRDYGPAFAAEPRWGRGRVPRRLVLPPPGAPLRSPSRALKSRGADRRRVRRHAPPHYEPHPSPPHARAEPRPTAHGRAVPLHVAACQGPCLGHRPWLFSRADGRVRVFSWRRRRSRRSNRPPHRRSPSSPPPPSPYRPWSAAPRAPTRCAPARLLLYLAAC